jgi:hypothetical protein
VSSQLALLNSTILKLNYVPNFILQVIANETNSSVEPNTTVIVIIQDVNEFNPVFDQAQYATNLTENSPLGMSLIKVN